ncbi:hypothetical protein CMV_026830 [Castanea mollissima]|uniref:NmrA-like domain-containing protein n=1 Tax=Castanea mollissima TaxID=60419 RepID=A0A8J4QAM0_9ROSI|nr:hypothetical protein CMV_026830 [Castanea mollissima]
MIRLAVGGRVGVDFQNLRLLIYHGHAAMLALSTFAHNRQNPTKGLLPELLLLLHDQTIVKVGSSIWVEEPIRKVDWEGKLALIQCAKAMGIQKYVFFSIHNCDKHPEVPLMDIKYCTEKFLQDSGLNHIIIRLCFFMQGLIGKYAVPILEEKSVWGTDAATRIAYMDTQDIAHLTFIALQ